MMRIVLAFACVFCLNVMFAQQSQVVPRNKITKDEFAGELAYKTIRAFRLAKVVEYEDLKAKNLSMLESLDGSDANKQEVINAYFKDLGGMLSEEQVDELKEKIYSRLFTMEFASEIDYREAKEQLSTPEPVKEMTLDEKKKNSPR